MASYASAMGITCIIVPAVSHRSTDRWNGHFHALVEFFCSQIVPLGWNGFSLGNSMLPDLGRSTGTPLGANRNGFTHVW
jgi:hypothetical protein